MRVRSALPVLALLALAAPAFAQSASPTRREGFVVGFGLGFGSTYPCDNCPSGAFDFFVGAMATPNVALVADFSVVGNGDDLGERGRSMGVMALGVRVWPVERFWLLGGVGIGSELDDEFGNDFDDDIDDFDLTDGETSWAALVGAGFDVVSKGRFTMDVRVRASFIEGRQSVALGLGFNWY
jgi:hypothetical protein